MPLRRSTRWSPFGPVFAAVVAAACSSKDAATNGALTGAFSVRFSIPESGKPAFLEVPFPSEPTIHDFDKDGDLDVMIPAGFLVCTLFERQCGSLIWYENDGRAGGWAPHVIVPPGDRLFYHRAEIVDFDGDSIEDLVTIGEYFSASSREALTVWFKGTNDALRFETTARPIGEGGGSLPTVLDLDGDGDLDVASANFFLPNESAIWFERTGNPNSAEPNTLTHGPSQCRARKPRMNSRTIRITRRNSAVRDRGPSSSLRSS